MFRQFLKPPIFLLLSLSLVLSDPQCPLSSTYWPERDLCLFLPKYQMSWYGGEDYCKYLGGHLLSIHSEEENQYVVNISTYSRYWQSLLIGLSEKPNRTRQWTDGSPVDFTNGMYPNTLPDAFYGVSILLGMKDDVPVGTSWSRRDPNKLAEQLICGLPPCSSTVPRSTLLPGQQYPTGMKYADIYKKWFVIFGNVDAFSYGEQHCQELGGHLPSVSNAFQNSQLNDLCTMLLSIQTLVHGIGLMETTQLIPTGCLESLL